MGAVKRILIALFLCLAGTGAMAPSLHADDPLPCTLIGCNSGIAIEVTKARDEIDRLAFCVQDRCRAVPHKRGRVSVSRIKVDCTEEITVRGVLTARDSEGRKLGRYKALIPMKATYPNGEACGPACFNRSVRFNGSRLMVLPPPG
jgi:hypothetical protein